jgi:hypothetical protein
MAAPKDRSKPSTCQGAAGGPATGTQGTRRSRQARLCKRATAADQQRQEPANTTSYVHFTSSANSSCARLLTHGPTESTGLLCTPPTEPHFVLQAAALLAAAANPASLHSGAARNIRTGALHTCAAVCAGHHSHSSAPRCSRSSALNMNTGAPTCSTMAQQLTKPRVARPIRPARGAQRQHTHRPLGTAAAEQMPPRSKGRAVAFPKPPQRARQQRLLVGLRPSKGAPRDGDSRRHPGPERVRCTLQHPICVSHVSGKAPHTRPNVKCDRTRERTHVVYGIRQASSSTSCLGTYASQQGVHSLLALLFP